MQLPAIHALYDGERIHLLEDAPVQGRYRVLVTFVAPADAQDVETAQEGSRSLWDTFGAWQDERSADEIVREIREARRSRTAPPSLAQS